MSLFCWNLGNGVGRRASFKWRVANPEKAKTRVQKTHCAPSSLKITTFVQVLNNWRGHVRCAVGSHGAPMLSTSAHISSNTWFPGWRWGWFCDRCCSLCLALLVLLFLLSLSLYLSLSISISLYALFAFLFATPWFRMLLYLCLLYGMFYTSEAWAAALPLTR